MGVQKVVLNSLWLCMEMLFPFLFKLLHAVKDKEDSDDRSDIRRNTVAALFNKLLYVLFRYFIEPMKKYKK